MVAMMQTPAPPAYNSMSQAHLIEIIETQKAVIREKQETITELQWHDEIMSNTKLPIAARFAARAARKFVQERKPCDDGYYKAYLPAMAELAGVSASTISRGIELLHDATEALDKHTEEVRNEKGHVEKNVLYIRPRETFDQALAIIPTKDVPKHGGNRRLPCPDCGCVHRIVKRREECANCHHKFFEDTRTILGNDPDPLQDEIGEETRPIIVDASIEVPAEPEPLLQLETLSVHTSVSPCNETEVSPSVATCNSIPDELKALPQWVCWRYEPKKDKEDNLIPDAKPDKVPYVAELSRGRQHASCSEAKTWRSYDQAQAIYEQSLREGWKYPYDGIMFAFKKNGGYAGVDFDNCIDENGNMSDLAQAWMIDSYGEISPSHIGFKQIVRGSIERNIKRSDIGVEMYDHSRFFTITGMHLPCTPATIKDQQEQLTALFAAIAPPAPLPKEAPRADTVYTPACPLDDDEVLKKARGASNGTKFTLLWEGKWEEVLNDKGQKRYGSQSEADQALCCMLAFSTGRDSDAMDRLFRQSGLYRKKWDRNVGAGEKYGERAIRKALEV